MAIGLATLFKEIDMSALVPTSKLFDDFFKDFPSGYFVRPLHGEPLPDPGQIKVDVKDMGNEYLVHADLPGVKKENIQVHVKNGVVTLRAEMAQEDNQTTQGKLVHCERYAGAISRSFTLATDIDEAKSKAKYENGVLTLHLPKHTAHKGSRLLIA